MYMVICHLLSDPSGALVATILLTVDLCFASYQVLVQHFAKMLA